MDNNLIKAQNAFEANVIDEQTFDRIKEYNIRLSQNNVPVIYNLRHLRKTFKITQSEQELYFGQLRKDLYYEFEIPKKSGGMRLIEAPQERLKNIQRWIKDNIIDSFTPSEYAMGFRKGLSIVHNAEKHVGKELVINFDIKDFFPSIKYADVFKLFVYMGYRKDVAHLLTRLCTNASNVLPQGSPASPSISNLVLLKLDKRLSCLAESIGCDYSRYADDITFSGNRSIESIVPLVKKIVVEEGFQINEDKVRLQYSYQCQEVTGLIVNKKLSVSRKIIEELDNAIYFCKKYGVADHMRHIKCDKSFYQDHLYGLAYFVNMVDKEKGIKYLERLDEINW